MPNAWTNHVKNYARENNLTYGCAINEPRCKASYKKPVKQQPASPPETKTFRKKRAVSAPVSEPEPETKTFRKKRPPAPIPPPPSVFIPPPPPQTLASFTEPNLTKREHDLLQETKKIFRDFTRGVRTGNSNIDYMNESIAREYAKKIESDYAKRRSADYSALMKNMKKGGSG